MVYIQTETVNSYHQCIEGEEEWEVQARPFTNCQYTGGGRIVSEHSQLVKKSAPIN